MTAGNFSQAPGDVLADALSKGYVSLHVEQGVPVLDRDLNLLGDLISAALQQIVRSHVGDGIAGTADFAVTGNGNPLDFAVAPGSHLAGGRLVTLAAGTTYLTQAVPAGAAAPATLTAPTPGQPVPRTDTVYLDAWADEIDHTTDPALRNTGDVGLPTSTRTRAQFVVRVAENAPPPPPAAGHAFVPLAQIVRGPGNVVSFADLRVTRLSISQVARRLQTIETVLAPVIDSVAPNLVLPGQANPMVVSGRNLNLGGVRVTLGGMPANVQAGATAISLSVEVPANAPVGAQPLRVETAIGATTAPLPVTVQQPPSPPAFAPGPNPAPMVPGHAPTGAQIVLNGSHFTGVNRVLFNTVPPVAALPGGDLLAVTDAVITVRVPDALSAAAGGTMTVTVGVDGVPSMVATSATLFTVDPQPVPAPKFLPAGSQISTNPVSNPVAQARGGQVTLRGTNFGTSTATTSVTFLGNAGRLVVAPGDVVSVAQGTVVVKVPAALTVNPAPNNRSKVIVTVQGVEVPSDDSLLVT